MRRVLVDTLYWVAMVNPKDAWHKQVMTLRQQLGTVPLVTTDGVLVEFLNTLADYGPGMREMAAQMVREILSSPRIHVVEQSRDTLLEGLQLYENRQDKEYSLTDCISMNAMKARKITEILTNDHHFTREGFTILVPVQV